MESGNYSMYFRGGLRKRGRRVRSVGEMAKTKLASLDIFYMSDLTSVPRVGGYKWVPLKLSVQEFSLRMEDRLINKSENTPTFFFFLGGDVFYVRYETRFRIRLHFTRLHWGQDIKMMDSFQHKHTHTHTLTVISMKRNHRNSRSAEVCFHRAQGGFWRIN